MRTYTAAFHHLDRKPIMRTRAQTREAEAMEAMEAALYTPTAIGSTATTSNPHQTLNSTTNTGNPLHTNNATTSTTADDTNNDIAPPPYSTNTNTLIPNILDHTSFPRNILIALTMFYNAHYLSRRTSPPNISSLSSSPRPHCRCCAFISW